MDRSTPGLRVHHQPLEFLQTYVHWVGDAIQPSHPSTPSSVTLKKIRYLEELMVSNCAAGEDSWESLDSKETKPDHPKGNQSWMFTGRSDAEAETPILWPPDAKNWLIRKDPDAGEDWRQEEKGTTEDDTVGWHHRLNGHKFEQTLGDGEGQGSLVCCSPWGHKESSPFWRRSALGFLWKEWC